jgi:hypothetical protein
MSLARLVINAVTVEQRSRARWLATMGFLGSRWRCSWGCAASRSAIPSPFRPQTCGKVPPRSASRRLACRPMKAKALAATLVHEGGR